MNGVLVVAETRQGALRDISAELVAAARQLADAGLGPVSVAVIGSDAEGFKEQLNLAGVDTVLAVSVPTGQFEAHAWEVALERVIDEVDPAAVLLGHTIDSLGFVPSLAARLGLGLATDVTSVRWSDGTLHADRGAYGGKVVSRVELPAGRRGVLLVRGGTFAPVEEAGSAELRSLDAGDLAAPRATHLGYREVAVDDVDITTAEVLLSVGRGIGDEEELPRFVRLAAKIGATLSVSRPLVDAGWATAARQVGQSGKTVKPKVYIALGISGAVQHLAGMRDADTIIAVNTDPEAPIFGVAHYGVIGDLFEVAQGLEEAYG